ncbi:MAG: lysylphosphatidylglycerol synthase transmembrane domain-containing protein [Cytophagales bacterium]|nr:lysylphosphatidylglycerol synthase transmembrane domain-containing protein [Cytophagales bacterium]
MDFQEILQNKTKNRWFQMANYVFFFIVGMFLLYLAFKGQDMNALANAFAEANYYYLIPLLAATILNHVIRALRWQMLMKPLGHSPSFVNTFTTMMFGYFVNYGIPRVGELVRCWALQKKEKVPATASFGTVMVERLVDLLVLAMLVSLVFVLRYTQISDFFTVHIFSPLYIWANDKFMNNNKLIFIILGLAALLVYWLYEKSKKVVTEDKISKLDQMINEVWDGLNAFLKLKNYTLFIIYTLLIWVGYFLTTYFWVLAFEQTANFDFMTVTTIMVVGTLGRSLPIQGGGMGSYHFFIAKILLVFGVNETVGNAFAILNHGAQAIFQIVFGILCGVYIFYGKSTETDKSTISQQVIS